MPWSKWNDADKTLFFAALIFVFALCLHLSFPESLFSKGALFCAEAALVGGVADWFAVTALFEKPLGFPWHTALLPRRRTEFMEAAAKLVRREFFSRRAVFGLTAQYDWNGLLLQWLESDSVRSMLAMEVRRTLSKTAQNVDTAEQSKKWAAQIRHIFLSVPLAHVLEAASKWLQKNENDRRLFGSAASYFRAWLERPETRDDLASLFERIQNEKLASAGFFMNLLAGVASAMNVVNFDDLAACTQQEALRLLEEAESTDSPLGLRIREIFYERLEALGEDKTAQEAFAAARGALLRAMPLEQSIEAGLSNLLGALQTDLPTTESENFPAAIQKTVDKEVGRWLSLLRTDETVSAAFSTLTEDVVRRSALEAQTLSSVIVREALVGMTDEKLNAIVYEKVEPDLLWIRMNGSIVGAIVGLALFLITAATKQFI